MDECAALWLGYNPEVIYPETLLPYASHPQAKLFREGKSLIGRAIRTGDLVEPIRPRTFAFWSASINRPLAEALTAAIAKVATSDNARIRQATEQPGQSDPSRMSSAALTTERNSMLALIGSMARDKYGYRSGAQRQESTSKIRGATERAGVALDNDTVLKYLRMSDAYLVQNEDKEPNSD